MSNRTNFVKVENLPICFNNGPSLFNTFASCGQVQDISAVGPTTVIVSYAMRSQAENAEFALDNVDIGGNQVTVRKYFPQSDPQFFSNPVYQTLGKFIGQDQHWMNPNNFQPWPSGVGGASNNRSNISASAPQTHHQQASLGNASGPSNFGGGASGGGDVISNNSKPWTGSPGDECAICLCDNDSDSLTLPCGHSYHRACLEALIKSSAKTYLECPTCKKVYGTKTGNMPTTGKIKHILTNHRLPGYENCGCIEITYYFSPGIQGPEHPQPGQPYNCHAFPRKAYLPDNKEGEMALHGIYMAWNQRLLFTIGTSLTTGMSNTITWNDIHMKTQPSGGQHGYPDPNYLTNLKDDLSVRGITEAAIVDHMSKHPGLRTRGHM